MTAYDFEGNDWDEITESEKRAVVQRIVNERDAISDNYETLVAEHDRCGPTSADYPAEGPVPTAVQNVWNEVGDAALAQPEPGLTEQPCWDCGGNGYTIGADPLPSGEPGEPYHVQCGSCGGSGVVVQLVASEPGLDVERLARALEKVGHDGRNSGRAADVAAEYARLGADHDIEGDRLTNPVP